ncbi:MAG: SpoIIE family protein phosphatase [Verrucomicrobia bacterium]|nr:SpoIIE family protein phosphatase [Verrucomicrobiota bacterium]MBU1909623.1 SpoIIE family protein phosphatase [Verrucomicrobiota bacterium]
MTSLFVAIPAVLLQGLLLGALLVYYRRFRRLRAERNLLQQEREVIYGFVHDVSEVFAGTEEADIDLLLKRVLFYALRTSRAGAGALYLFEPGGRQLRARVISGIFPPLVGGAPPDVDRAVSKSRYVEQLVRAHLVNRGEGLVGGVADLGAPLLIEDAERDVRVPRFTQDILRIRSILLIPLRFQRQVMGVLVVVNRVDGRPFIQADQSLLQALADQASVSMHYTGLREALADKRRMDQDLSAARRIQETLLPKELPRIEGLELAAFNDPALEIGGDYYDFVRLGDSHLGFAIADVSGKGIGGAIMMSVCRSVLRAEAPRHAGPAQVLRVLNKILGPDVSEDMFVSLLYMVLNIRTRELVMARAGHERPLLCRAGGHEVTVLDSPGVGIGVAGAEVFDRALNEVTVTLEPGDVVVAYTDGITEAMNAEGEEWGLDRFLESVSRSAAEGANSVLNHVRGRLERFVGNQPQYDDMTLIALRVMG